jgi:hypothetical protein
MSDKQPFPPAMQFAVAGAPGEWSLYTGQSFNKFLVRALQADASLMLTSPDVARGIKGPVFLTY